MLHRAHANAGADFGGGSVLCGGSSAKLKLWDTQSRKCLMSFKGPF